MKRICLFAAYNNNDYIEEYVFDYLKELSIYTDIYYMADGDLVREEDINKLLYYCKNVFFIKHEKYDFGSYSELAKKYIGWNKIEEYDEMILANDSVFFVQSFKTVFEKMNQKNCDAWGLLATDERNYEYFYTLEEYLTIPASKVPYFCIGSYFIVLRNNVIKDKKFQVFLNSVKKESNRHDVCMKYEMGLTKFLQKNNFKINTFIDVVYRNVIVYNEQGIRLLKQGFPLVKNKIFKENPLSLTNLEQLPKIIEKYTQNSKIHSYISSTYLANNDSKRKQNIIDELLPPFFKNSKKEILKQLLPPFVIKQYKNIKYSNIKKNKLNNKFDFYLENPEASYIIYFNVAVDTIGGGMLSINRFIDRSIDKFQDTNTKILLSGLPLSNPEVKYTMFDSQLNMFHFDEILASIYPEKLILNIPEYYLPDFIHNLKEKHKKWLHSIPYLHINIMNQNHDYFPERAYFEHCKIYTDKVTITTAHKEYTTQEIADDVDCPIKLLTPFLPKFYRTPYQEKEKIIAISPDELLVDGVSKKDITLEYLRKNLNDYKIIIINNISLEEYKRLISKAMFTITFGEGYDGYYIEPFLSNSISFAIYNTTFFPEQFKKAPTVYESYEKFMKNIVDDIKILEKNYDLYKEYSDQSEKMIKEITNDEISLQNLEDFYNDKYDYIPEIAQRSGFYKKIKLN